MNSYDIKLNFRFLKPKRKNRTRERKKPKPKIANFKYQTTTIWLIASPLFEQTIITERFKFWKKVTIIFILLHFLKAIDLVKE